MFTRFLTLFLSLGFMNLCLADIVPLSNCTLYSDSEYYFYNAGEANGMSQIFVMPYGDTSVTSVRVQMTVSGGGYSFNPDACVQTKNIRVDSVGEVVDIYDKSFEFLERILISFVNCRVVIEPSAGCTGFDVGLDLFSGGGKTRRSAEAKVFGPSGRMATNCTFNWLSCGKRCQFVGGRSGATVEYENKFRDDKVNGPSTKVGEEKLLVEVGIPCNGVTRNIRASASFTVVMVDAEVAGIAEEAEERGNATAGISNVGLEGMSAYAREHQARVMVTIKPDAIGSCQVTCDRMRTVKSEVPGQYVVSSLDPDDGREKGFFIVQHPGSGARDRVCFSKTGEIDATAMADFPVNKKRSRFGVGETVILDVIPVQPAEWSTTHGRLESSVAENESYLYVDDSEGAVQVEARLSGGMVLVKNFEVVPPLEMGTATFLKEDFVRSIDVGVNFRVQVPVCPSDVSFQNVEFMEVGTDAIELDGEFANDPPSSHSHKGHGADRWFQLDGNGKWRDNQKLVFDNDSNYVLMGNGQRDRSKFPYVGSARFNWEVPMKWRICGKTGEGDEHSLPAPELQEHFVDDGTTTIRKFNHSHSRTVPSP